MFSSQARLLRAQRAEACAAMMVSLFVFFFSGTMIGAVKGPPKLVGINYETNWGNVTSINYDMAVTGMWGTPFYGTYASDDTTVITRHANQISGAGIDFIFIDWSNNIDCLSNCATQYPGTGLYQLEQRTNTVYSTIAAMTTAHPKILIYLGCTGINSCSTNISNGQMQYKVDQVYNTFIANSTYNSVYQYWQGKPLLMISLGLGRTTPYSYTDSRFTIRWVGGWLQAQNPGPSGQVGIWSFKDGYVSGVAPTWAADPAYTTITVPEHGAITDSFPGQTGWDSTSWNRDGLHDCTSTGGEFNLTGHSEFNRVWDIDPEILTIASWNEWVVPSGDQKNPACSIDMEASTQLGSQYYNDVKGWITSFRKHRDDIGARDNSSGIFFFLNSQGYAIQTQYDWTAGSNYQPITGDWNGDGIGDVGVYDQNTGIFYFKNGYDFGNNGQTTYQWTAGANYRAITGDFNGDGKWDIGLWDTNTGILTWKFGPNFTTGGSYNWGASGTNYQPITGDFNNDGVWDIGLYDPNIGVFTFKMGPNFGNNQSSYTWSGGSGSQFQAIAGDFNGDGYWDIGLRDGSIGTFSLKHGPSYSDLLVVTWGGTGTQYQPYALDVR